ncbi:MAG: hypothetical protein AAGC55_14950, partial [Myxococcota bacterium]
MAGSPGENARLLLTEQSLVSWLRIDHLELEIPGVAAPQDSDEGDPPRAETYQRRRTVVRGAALRIDQTDIERYIAERRTRLSELGFDAVEIRIGDGYLAAAAQLKDGKVAAEMSFRLCIGVCPGGLRVLIADAQMYGFLSVPAPLAAHRLIAALLGINPNATPSGDRDADARPTDAAAATGRDNGEHSRARRSSDRYMPLTETARLPDAGGRPRHLPAIIGLGQFELEPLSAFLWSVLPLSGWRLPATSSIELDSVRISRGAVAVSYSESGRARRALRDSARAAQMDDLLAASRELDRADRALLAGDSDSALALYRGELAAAGPDKPLLVERILAVCVTRPALFVEAGELARKTLERKPGSAPAHAALASIAAAQSHAAGAALHYRRLVDLSEDDLAAIRAALAGARLSRTVQPAVATQLYEQVIERSGDHAEAAAALAERYAAESRWSDLAALLRGRIA